MKVIETAESPAKLTLYFISYSYIGWAALAGPQWPRPTDPHYPLAIIGTVYFFSYLCPFAIKTSYKHVTTCYQMCLKMNSLPVKGRQSRMLLCREDNHATKMHESGDSAS